MYGSGEQKTAFFYRRKAKEVSPQPDAEVTESQNATETGAPAVAAVPVAEAPSTSGSVLPSLADVVARLRVQKDKQYRLEVAESASCLWAAAGKRIRKPVDPKFMLRWM